MRKKTSKMLQIPWRRRVVAVLCIVRSYFYFFFWYDDCDISRPPADPIPVLNDGIEHFQKMITFISCKFYHRNYTCVNMQIKMTFWYWISFVLNGRQLVQKKNNWGCSEYHNIKSYSMGTFNWLAVFLLPQEPFWGKLDWRYQK